MTDTIFALSSGRPPAGVAVIRLSGPLALATAAALAGKPLPPRVATLAELRDPASGALLDRGLALAFRAPASFTGEDVAEFQIHGGPAVIAALLDCLGRQPGLRLAAPGEFSRRAFDNGKLDLSQAEGLADLIDARTEAQRVRALAQAGGALREAAERWRAAIIAAMAEIEAGLDFADEDDVTAADAGPALTALRDELTAHLARATIGERLRDGFVIAVVGEPNVGKSSLVNALARREVAIVSDIAGTTRDAIEVPLDLAGVPATLIDTAGLRESDDPVEAEGVRRARARAAEADLVLHVAETPPTMPLGQVVLNKADLHGRPTGRLGDMVSVSAADGSGLPGLSEWLREWAVKHISTDEAPLVSRARHRIAMERTVAALDEGTSQNEPALQAESLRSAAQALAEITGRVAPDHVLNALFGRFCIGK